MCIVQRALYDLTVCILQYCIILLQLIRKLIWRQIWGYILFFSMSSIFFDFFIDLLYITLHLQVNLQWILTLVYVLSRVKHHVITSTMLWRPQTFCLPLVMKYRIWCHLKVGELRQFEMGIPLKLISTSC